CKADTLWSNPNKDTKYGRSGIEEVIGSVVVMGGVLTFIIEATSSMTGRALSKLRNLLAKLDEIEELCFEPSVFCEEVSVACVSSMTCSYDFP
ncbi:hypothetical protein Tco_1197848, partial [Tanacetum coccineum]